MTTRFERALADLVGGYEGGFALWLVCLMRLDLAAAASRDFDAFRRYPEGHLNRLLTAVDDALRTGDLAVELERTLQSDGDSVPDEKRRADVADLLFDRARGLADARLNLAPDEWPPELSPRRRRQR